LEFARLTGRLARIGKKKRASTVVAAAGAGAVTPTPHLSVTVKVED